MFLILVFILTIISFSLKLMASGVDLAEKVAGRSPSNNKNRSELNNKMRKVANVGLATSTAYIRALAFIVARVRDLVGIAGTFVYTVALVIFLVCIVSVSSFVTVFTEVDKDGNLQLTSDLKSTTTASQTIRGTTSSTTSSTSVLTGIKESSWDKADETGKKVALFASNAILNPPNGKYLEYSNDTKITKKGYFDCITFVEAVLQGSVNKSLEGKKTKKGFDFSKDAKPDIENRYSFPEMWSIINGKSGCKLGKSTNSNLKNKAQPGDLLVSSGHIGIYLGVNTKGKHVMVHASTYKGYCRSKPDLTGKKGLEVGFSTVGSDNYTIIRTSTLIGE